MPTGVGWSLAAMPWGPPGPGRCILEGRTHAKQTGRILHGGRDPLVPQKFRKPRLFGVPGPLSTPKVQKIVDSGGSGHP